MSPPCGCELKRDNSTTCLLGGGADEEETPFPPSLDIHGRQKNWPLDYERERERELNLSLTSCNTWESRFWNLPGKQG